MFFKYRMQYLYTPRRLLARNDTDSLDAPMVDKIILTDELVEANSLYLVINWPLSSVSRVQGKQEFE